MRALTRPVPWSIDWFRHVRECISPADYLTRPYYDQWLQTYAAMMVDSGLTTVEELAAGRAAAPLLGVAAPMTPDKVLAAARSMARFDREGHVPSAFAPGETVRTRISGARGHTRLPQYARGRRGRIEAFHGFHVLPDTNLAGGGPAEPLYTVAFAASDLWPEEPGLNHRVHLDLWESYLEPA